MKLLISLILLLTVFLAACTLPQEDTITGDIIGSSCNDLSGAARDDCYSEALSCSKIQNEQVRDSCVAELAKIKQDPAVCNLIQTSSIKGFCQGQIAIDNNNLSACEVIEDPYWNDNCLFHLAINNNISNPCPKITSPTQKEECFKEVALATDNPGLCNFLGENLKEKCFYTIAKHTLDVNLCKAVTNPINQNACRVKIAKLSNNETICEEVTMNSMKEVCKEYFKEN